MVERWIAGLSVLLLGVGVGCLEGGSELVGGGEAASPPAFGQVFPGPAPVGEPAPRVEAMTSCGIPGVDGGEEGVMVLAVGDELWLRQADGELRVVHRFGEGTADVAVSQVSQLVARGDHVVGLATLRDGDGGEGPYAYVPARGHEVVRLGRDGEVDWHRVFEAHEASWVWSELGPDGTLAVGLAGDRGVVVWPDGEETTAAGMPVAVMPNGRVLIREVRRDYVSPPGYHWLSRGSGEPVALAEVPASWPGPLAVGSWLVYLTEPPMGEAGAWRLVVESAEGAWSVGLPEPDPSASYWSAAILDAVPEGYAIIGRQGSTDERWLVDLAAGTLTTLEVRVPEGLREFDRQAMVYVDPGQDLRLDHQGALLLGLRDATAASLYRSTDGGASWTPLGLDTREVWNVTGLGVAGSYLIEAMGGSFGMAGLETWDEATTGREPALTGGALQIWRPDSEVLVVLAPDETGGGYYGPGHRQQTDLTPDGRCLSVWHLEEGERVLRVVDLETGLEAEALRLWPDAGAAQSSWIPGRALRPNWQ